GARPRRGARARSRSLAADARAARSAAGRAAACRLGPCRRDCRRGDRVSVADSGSAVPPMRTHPLLRAYMAGIAVPTPFLIAVVTGFTIARSAFRVPVTLEHVIIFPMAVVPNAWGLWNMLRVAMGAGDRWPIG